MSKIGKLPITIPQGITVTLANDIITVSNGKETLSTPMLRGVTVTIEENEVIVALSGKSVQARSNWGTLRALIANAIEGLSKGFEKTLILEGIGFRIAQEGKNLTLSLGFSHPVKYTAPDSITFEVEKNSKLKVKGNDKQVVGQVAAEIRALKKPEPYKGTGFHYSDEVVQRKAGKKAATASGGA